VHRQGGEEGRREGREEEVVSTEPWRNRELIALAQLARSGNTDARKELVAQVLPAIIKWEGNLKAIGEEVLHVDSDTLRRWFKFFPELSRALNEERAKARKSPVKP
jgi:hypothetical protein